MTNFVGVACLALTVKNPGQFLVLGSDSKHIKQWFLSQYTVEAIITPKQ